MDKIYELIDHTADLSIKVYGKDLEELLKNSSKISFPLLTILVMVNVTII